MKILVEIKENELLKAAGEMLEAADELGYKAHKLKSLIVGEDVKTPPENDGE